MDFDSLQEILIFNTPSSTDNRGTFCKLFNETWLPQNSAFNLKEEFYSVSQKGVLRGLHFQTPPYQHTKIVSVIKGEILDVLVDLRKSSTTYRKVFTVQLKELSNSILIPKGFAHGFLSLSDESIVHYKTDSIYKPDYDHGVLWSSIDFPWPIKNPIVSVRDSNFPKLNDFDSPF